MLHFSSFIETLPYVAIPVLLYCMCGYFFLNKMLRVNLRKNLGFWVSLPVYLGVGIVVYTFILYTIGLVIFNESVVIVSAMFILLLFLGNILFSMKRSGIRMKASLDLFGEKNLREYFNQIRERPSKLVPTLVFAVSFLYLTSVITIFMWPPMGDIINHGFYTSLIIYDQRIPNSFLPFVNWSWYYPLGLHVSAADLALLLGIYPGEAVLLFGGILMIALTSLVFTLTFVITRSKLLSVLAYVLTYLTYTVGGSGGDLEHWIFGYLFNGPYPNIYGFLIILLSITAVAIHGKTKDQYILLRLLPILTIVLLLTYPSFVFVSALLFLFAFLHVGLRKTVKEFFGTKRDALFTIVLAAVFTYFLLYFYSGVFATVISSSGTQFPVYVVPQAYLLASIPGYSVILSFVTSCFLITSGFMRRSGTASSLPGRNELFEFRPILLVQIVLGGLLILSLSPQLFGFTQYLLPSRLAIVAMMVSLTLSVYALSKISNFLIEKYTGSRFARKHKKTSRPIPRRSSARMRLDKLDPNGTLPRKKKTAVVIVVFIFFSANGLLVYSLYSQATFQLANSWAWYSHTDWFNDDFSAMEWIHANVKDRELVLNDWSWDGLYVTSLGALNVTMQYIYMGLNRTTDLQVVWLLPMFPDVVKSVIKRYNVSYVFTTGEWGYYDFMGDQTYKAKPYLPSTYINILSNYTFLELVFKSGNAAVFKVNW